MRFLVGECTGPAVAAWLRTQSHDVFSVFDEARGMKDVDVLVKAFAEELRLANPRSSAKIMALQNLIVAFELQLPDRFVTVSDTQVRFGA